MSSAMGLYPDVIVGIDEKRLCFTLLDSNSHRVLNITPEQYTIIGNTIVFKSDCALAKEELMSLVSSGFTYRLLKEPETIPNNSIHTTTNLDRAFLEKDICKPLTITFILDKIETLPAFHYPYLSGYDHQFSNNALGVDRIKEVLSQIRYYNRIRLLSNDILQSEVLASKELGDLELETIIGQDYFLSHFGAFSTFPRCLRLIVYIDDLAGFDEDKCVPLINNEPVSYFCQIRNMDELKRFEKSKIQAIPFPAPDAPEEVVHAMLDYSVDDLLQTTTRRKDLFLNHCINSNFYGTILIDNDGNINSYPFKDYEINNSLHFGKSIKHLKENHFWRLRRPDFFSECRKCAFAELCPPLSNYEINLRQTFCTGR